MKKVFVDSDVILSSLLSSKGAANFLLNEVDLKFVMSTISLLEIERGIAKLNLDKNQLRQLVKNRLKLIELKDSLKEIGKSFRDYVFDEDDAHIVAGAESAKARFLISYNIKDYKLDKIKNNLNIIIMMPGKFLQHLRSLQ